MRRLSRKMRINRVFSLPNDFSEELGEVVQIVKDPDEDRLIIRPVKGTCIICGQIAVEYLFGKGVCQGCLNLAQLKVHQWR